MVRPFLKSLKNTVAFPIQQVAIVGTPDYLLSVRGKFVALELKSEGGKVSALQAYNLAQVERTGGIVLVATPKNWIEIKTKLNNLDRG